MIIKPLTFNAKYPSTIVSWTVGGLYHQADTDEGEGVELPDVTAEQLVQIFRNFQAALPEHAQMAEAVLAAVPKIIDVSYYGSHAMTQQVVFTPAWPDALDAPRA